MARIYIDGKKVNELPHKQNPEGSDQLLVQDEQSNYSTLDELKNYIVDGYATEESVTQEVNTAIANLIGTAPESLDTLQELAEALNNDDDFAATVTNKLGEHDTAISNLQNADTELSNRITALESENANDYTELENKPQINSITLEGNKTLTDLGIQPAGDYALKSEIPEIQDAVMLTLSTDLANGNGTIIEDILTKITTARTNKQPIYVINDRPALPVVELAIVTDGTNEQSQGTIDLIMPTRIDADGNATQVVYQIVGSASTTLTITTITREVQSDTTGLVQRDEFNTKLDQKQDRLISGTNIKTINGESILGEGNIEITSGGYYDEDVVSYGVEWDITVDDPDLTRIGNPLLHKQLPIQSELKGCVAKGNQIQYMLNPSNWNYKQNGEPSVLDGTDGDVYVRTIGFYGKSEEDGNKRRVRISTVNVDGTYTYIPPMLISAYRVSRDYTNGSDNDNAKLRSVINTNGNFRGGTNDTSYDMYLDTDIFRTLLGKPATNISRATARIQARNNGTELLNYEYYKWILYWLPVIEYATFNIQQNFIEELTVDGYHQGGLGVGITEFNYDNWRLYNRCNPVVPNGYGNDLGNFTGVKDVSIAKYTATSMNDLNMSSWSTLANCVGTKGNTIVITAVNQSNVNLTSRVSQYCSGRIIYNITGVSEDKPIIFYTNDIECARATVEGDITVEWGSTLTARYIRAGFIGDCNITISLVSSENTELEISAINLSLARYRGFENIFGDIWTNLDGVIINCSSTLHPDDLNADVYATTDPSKYADSVDAINNMIHVGTQIGTEGYVKEFGLGTNAEIIPNQVGGSSNKNKCDYCYRSAIKDYMRMLIIGGAAFNGGGAGLGCFYSAASVGSIASVIGFRTQILL